MNKKLNDALNEVSDKHLSEAEHFTKSRRRTYWFGAIAAVLALVICITAISGGLIPGTSPVIHGTTPNPPVLSGITNAGSLKLSNLIAAPVYPQMAQKPRENDYSSYKDYLTALANWERMADTGRYYTAPQGYADSLTDFFSDSAPEFLNSEKNSTYSPLSIYIALAMLAETTDGNSRQQILDVLGLDSVEALREQVNHVWNVHYCDDGATTLLLANSLWLDNGFSFHQSTADILAENHHASSFHGNLSSSEMNKQLHAWLNANTGGLLQEQVAETNFPLGTVFALANTVYFTAGWETEFEAKNNQQMLFHCDGYDLQTIFMRRTLKSSTYYWGENFGAVRLELTGNNAMWLILPDEGYTLADILESDEYLQMTMDPAHWENRYKYDIHLSLPKFDVSNSDDTDIIGKLQNMGITDVFGSDADFSPLTPSSLQISEATHGARVVIDEEGCMAAAFTLLIEDKSPSISPLYPEIDFTLDRPFLFVISSQDNLPMFIGTVTQP